MEGLENLKFYIAKKSFSSSVEKRIGIYKKIKSFMEQGVPVKTICISILGKTKDGDSKPETYFLKHLLETLGSAGNFSDSLEGWASPSELMLIRSGEESGNLPEVMDLTIDLMESMSRMKKESKKALSYPAILFLLLIGIIYGFASNMVPTLQSFGNQDSWSPSAKTLVDFSLFVKDNVLFIFLGVVGAIFGAVKTLPRWTGPVRDKFDKLPPWSIYREINSGLFLISAATLMKSGMPLRKSLRSIQADSNDYVIYNIDKMLENMAVGMSNGSSLNTPFLGEIGDDIEIYGEVADFENSMFEIGKKSIDQKIEKVQFIAGQVKNFVMVQVAIMIVWIYGSFMEIAQSGTSGGGF